MSKRTLLASSIAAILAVGSWFLLTRTTTSDPVAEQNAADPARIKATPAPVPLSAVGKNPDSAPTSSRNGELQGGPVTPPPNTTERPGVDDILAAPAPDHVTTARKLAALVLDPRSPMKERNEALAHALNLSANNEADVLLPMIKDPNLTAEQARTILSDALNQSLDWQAKLYLEALRHRKEPDLRKEIREHLAFLSDDKDHGDDPKSWEQPLRDAAALRNQT